MIKILIADDHAIIRKGLEQIVAEFSDIIIAGEATRGAEVLDMAGKKDYDVIVLDITLPDRSGLDILKQLKSIKPHLPVLILSIHPEEQYAIRALRAGASGYLTKESAPAELISAIRKVAKGGRYVSSSLAEKLVLELGAGSPKAPHQNLSDREYQVMCMIASGKTLTEIAKKSFLSIKTISTYRSRILEKMGMKNNAELTHYAIKNRLVE